MKILCEKFLLANSVQYVALGTDYKKELPKLRGNST